MNINVLPSPNEDSWIPIEDKSIGSSIKAAATITALTAAVLASAYLAYQNPRHWWLTTYSVAVVNLYTLPKCLRYGNLTIIKLALVTNLVALSALSVGGIGVAVYSLSQWMFASFKTYQLSSALFNTFLITGLMGYGIPVFKDALQKAYDLLQGVHAQERFATLQEQFNHQPEIGLGLLQGNLWQSFVLHLVLFQPHFVLKFCQIFQIQFPNYAWPIAAAFSGKINLEQFNDMLSDIENSTEDPLFQEGEIFAEAKENYYITLKLALRSLKSEDIIPAVNSLLSQGSKLIPDLLSNKQFLQLLTEEALDATNHSIETFLNLIDNWENLDKQYQELNLEVIELEQEIQNQPQNPNHPPPEEDDFEQRYEQLHEEYLQLRIEVENVYRNKRIWHDFADLWDHATDLPFERGEDLIEVFQNKNLFKDIDDLYRLILGHGQGAHQTLNDRLQHIKNKLIITHDDEISAVMYLAANKGFIKQDYEDLQEWLNLDSPHDLEEALADIGLATEEDLYNNDILPRRGQSSKEHIRNQLYYYIKNASKPHLAERVQHKDDVEQKSLILQIMEKVTRVVFYAITSGLILVPILIQPEAGMVGFVLGFCFFTLQRFGVPGMQIITDFSYECLISLPLGSVVYSLSNRRIFALTPQRREAANHFVEAHLFQKMRILNLQILIALFISHFSVRYEHPFLGSFLQGIAFSRDVVNLV